MRCRTCSTEGEKNQNASRALFQIRARREAIGISESVWHGPAEDASGWLGLHSNFEPCSGASARCFNRYMLERYNSFPRSPHLLRQQNASSPPSVADALLLSLSFTTNTSLALTATTQSLSESFKDIYHKDQDFPNKK